MCLWESCTGIFRVSLAGQVNPSVTCKNAAQRDQLSVCRKGISQESKLLSDDPGLVKCSCFSLEKLLNLQLWELSYAQHYPELH